jgi:predicted ATP-grasp superfamily ATP-dependent carboligase
LRRFLNDNKNLEGSVLFPASDLYALGLSKLKEELENSYYIPVPTYKVVRTLADKKEFYQSLSKFNVPHPPTYFPQSSQHVRLMSKNLKYSTFVKPSYSLEFWAKFQAKGFVANSADELLKYYILALEHGVDVIFQEIIPGLAAKNIYGIEGYFDKNSDPKAIFAHCRLRGWPPVFGNTCLRETVSIKDVIVPYETTIRYLKLIKYHGLMEAEWKRDPRDGVFKLLEINPRQSMQNTLPARCGINSILIAYLDAIGKEIRNLDSYETGIKWINFFDDFKSAMETRTPLKEWIYSVKNAREFSYFAADDLLPWILSSMETIKGTSFKIAKKIIKKFRSMVYD